MQQMQFKKPNFGNILQPSWLTTPRCMVFMSPILFFFLIIAFITILVLSLIVDSKSKFSNKSYDPYGSGIRFFQSRDDTGSPNTTLEERQVGGEKLIIEPLTSNPEPPNISEYYGIDASLKNGSVMIERENFENSALSIDELLKANKGM